MAGEKVAGVLSTKIKMDTTEAQKNMRQLNNDISSTVSILKQQEQEFRSSGDSVSALQTKISRLTETQNGYYEKLKLLKQAQNDVKDRLGESSTEYQKYQTQINKTITTISRYDDQINKAQKSLQYYDSGLAKLKQSYSEQQRLSQSLVERLRAEGKEWQANQEELKQSKNAFSNLKQQYDIQEAELGSLKSKLSELNDAYRKSQAESNRIAQSSGKASEAYSEQKQKMNSLRSSIDSVNSDLVKQQTRLNQTATDMAKAKNKTNDLSSSYRKIPKSVTTEIKAKTEKATSGVKTFTSAIKGSAIGAGIANVAIAGLNAVGDNLNASFERYDTLNNFPKVLQSMGASAEDSKKSMQTLKKGVDGLPTSLQDVAQATQKFMPLSKNADDAAKSALALNDAFLASRASSEDASRGLQQYTQMLSTGKVDLQSWKTLQETMPSSLQKVAKSFGIASGSTQELYQKLKSGEITMDELNQKFQELDKGANGFHAQAKQATDGIGTAMANLKNRAVAALTDIIGGFDKLIQKMTGSSIGEHINKLSSNFSKFGEKANKAIGGLAPTLKKLEPLFDSVGKVVKAALSGLKPIINAVKDSFDKLSKNTGTFKKTLDKLAPVIKVISDVLGKVLGGAIRFTVDLVVDLCKAFNTVTDWIGKLTKGFNNFVKNPVKVFSNGWKDMKSNMSKAVDAMNNKNSKLHDEMISKISDATGVSKKTLEDGYKGMEDSTQLFKDIFSGKWNKVGGDLKNITKDMSNVAKDIFQDMYDTLNEKTGGGLDKIKNGWNKLWENIINGIKSAVKTVGQQVANLVNNVIKPINSMLDGVKNGVNWVLDKFGADKWKGYKIPEVKFATGGTVGKGGTMALVNDAPGANYREMFATPDGKFGMFPKERNFRTFLPEGTQVLDGENSKALAEMMDIPHFKDGTKDKNLFEKIFDKGKDILDSIGDIIAHPIKFLEKVISDKLKVNTKVKFASNLISKAPSFFAKMGKDWIKKLAEDFKKKKEENGYDGKGSANSKNGVLSKSEFAKIAREAAKNMHQTLSDHDIDLLYHQAMIESNANPATGGGYDDHDGTGLPYGLFQYKLGTWKAWAVPGHQNIHSALDQMMAVLNDSSWRSDFAPMGVTRGWGPTGHRMMANGGFVNGWTNAIIGEAGPEVVVPLSANKQPRAISLLTQAVNKLNRNAGNNTQITNTQAESNVEAKLDTMIGLLANILGVNQEQLNKASNNGNLNAFYQQMQRDQSINNYQAF